jgi:hypothetical protein
MIENVRFGLVFAKTGSIIRTPMSCEYGGKSTKCDREILERSGTRQSRQGVFVTRKIQLKILSLPEKELELLLVPFCLGYLSSPPAFL